jgi:subtilisin-like proprotein convertase family protein
VLDLANNRMNQNGNTVNGELPGDQFTATARLFPARQQFTRSGLSVPINDLSTSSVSITVPSTSVVNGFTVTDINFRVSLSHTYTSDLVISLVAPGGRTVTLFNRRGGSGDNLNGTWFNDDVTTPISFGAAPFAGTFRPEQLLSAFDGINPVGVWTLRVQDVARQDVGRITGVTLDIATDPGQSATMFGMADATFTAAPVSVGPGVANGFTGGTPQLLAPPTATTPTRSAPAAPPTADVAVSGTAPGVAPAFGGMANFEPTSVAWFTQTDRTEFGLFSVA